MLGGCLLYPIIIGYPYYIWSGGASVGGPGAQPPSAHAPSLAEYPNSGYLHVRHNTPRDMVNI